MMSMIGSSLLTYIIGCFLDVMRVGAVNELGIPFYSANAFHISLVILPVFYTVSALLVVPFIKDNKD